jgi:hypothetical protein
VPGSSPSPTSTTDLGCWSEVTERNVEQDSAAVPVPIVASRRGMGCTTQVS